MRNTRALLMLGAALLLACAAVLVAARWIHGQTEVASDKISVAMLDIAMGVKITPEMVRMVEWPSNAMPAGAVLDPKLLFNRITRTDIQSGEPVTEAKLAPVGTTGGLSSVVAPGKRAMTVRVNDVVGVAGFALPGNFVDILVNTSDDAARHAGGAEQAISKIVLSRILVLAIAQESNRDDTKPKVVNAVTLELTPEQVEKLDLARSVGTLSLVLRNQVDPVPADTPGATKATLLDLKLPAAPVAAPAAPVVRTQAPRAPSNQVEVIKGLDRSKQQF